MASWSLQGMPRSLLGHVKASLLHCLGNYRGSWKVVCFSPLNWEKLSKVAEAVTSRCLCCASAVCGSAAGAEAEMRAIPHAIQGSSRSGLQVSTHVPCLLSLSPEQREDRRPSLSDVGMEEPGQERRAHCYF